MTVASTAVDATVEVLTAEQARTHVNRIRTNLERDVADIRAAWRGRAWEALDYDSWGSLVDHEFGPLPRSVIPELRGEGMSTRAIAAAVRVSEATVRNDLAATAQICAVAPSPQVTGLNGSRYPSRDAPSRLDQIRALADEGQTASIIAEMVGMSSGGVCQLARNNGIVIPGGRLAKEQRINRARLLAAEGATSQQIADELGVAVETIRVYVRDHDINVVADAVTHRRNVSSVRIVTATIDALDGLDAMFDHIDYATLPTDELDGWVTVLDASIKSLTTLRRRLKEITQP